MNPEIYDAFQELKGLDDNTFSFDYPGVMKLNTFLNDKGEEEEQIVVVDPEAKSEEEMKDDYNGEVILKCCVCGGLITKEPKEVIIDKELNRANVDEECPYCYNDSGFDVVGKVSVPTQLGDDEEVEEFVAEEEPVEETPAVEEDFTGGHVEFVQRVLGVPVYKRGDGVLTATCRGKSVQAKDIAGIEDQIRSIGDKERTHLDRLPESYKKACKKAIKSVSKKRALKEGLRSNIIEFPSGDYVYVEAEDGNLYAGGASNTGIFHEYEIDIEGEEPTDSELQELYDKIIEEHPEYEDEIDVLPEYEIDADEESELKDLYDKNVSEYPEYLEEIDESCSKKKLKESPMYDLRTQYDSRKSFNNKAYVDTDGKGNDTLYSYNTPVVQIRGDKVTLLPKWNFSATTVRHVKEFLKQHGFKADSLAQIAKDYGSTVDESCNKGKKKKLTEIKADEEEILDLWDEVYGAVAGDAEYKKGTHKRNNGVGLKPDRFNPINGNDIEVRGVDFDELKPVKDVIDNEFAGRGVTYDEYTNKHDRKYPARVVIHIPEEEIIDDVSVKIVKKGDKKDLDESIETILVETDSDAIKVEPSEDGKIKVEAEPKEEPAEDGAVIEPVDDELKAEIEANTDEEEEETDEDESSDNTDEIEEIDETEFDELGESYLKEVYNNVDSFKTTGGYVNGDKIKLEGVIKFKSGKQAKTSFVFESISKTSRGKYKMIGENLQITNRKNAYILTGTIKDKKFCLESLTYNYTAKDANGGKSIRAYGTKKLNK